MMLDSLVFSDFSEKAVGKISCVEKKSLCHIRVQQRTSKKYITIIENLAEDLDLVKILKALKRTLKCNGNIATEKSKKDDEDNPKVKKIENPKEYICLNGDHRYKVKEFFIKYKVCEKDEVIVHGY